MDKASENYQASKNKKRTVPELDDSQVRLLVELLASNVPTGEITRKLDISDIDLDIITTRLGISSIEEAKARLATYQRDDIEAEEVAVALREDARRAAQEAQVRFDKQEAERVANDTAASEAARENVRAREGEIKTEDTDRQRRFVDDKPKIKDLLAQFKRPSTRYVGVSVKTVRVDDSKFPAGLETSEFCEMLLHRGLSFVRDQYNVTNSDIRAEMLARRIRLDFDLLPR